jgi:mono/diheme cytochrome c family protein
VPGRQDDRSPTPAPADCAASRRWLATPPRTRGSAIARLALIAAAAFAALALGACGSEGVQVPEGDPLHDGALLFSERCGGCHSLSAAGTTGSANRALRNQGPNLNERIESQEDVLYAIRNGGFSGAIMPQNIVVGDDAELVADFVAEYAGDDVDRPPSPASEEAASEDESGPAAAP